MERGVVAVSKEQRTVLGSRTGWLKDENRGLRESSGEADSHSRPGPHCGPLSPGRGGWTESGRFALGGIAGRSVVTLPAVNRSPCLGPLEFPWTGWLPQGVRPEGVPSIWPDDNSTIPTY